MTRAGAVLALAFFSVAWAADADRLAKLKDVSTVEITTVGRKTGKAHTKPVWFVVEGDHLWVQAGKEGKADWYLNLKKTPEVKLEIKNETFTAHAKPNDDPATVERIHKMFLDKYTSAWLLSFFRSSIGRGRPVELTLD